MPSKTKNPLAEAMRELKADPTPAARPVVRTTLAGKAKPRLGEDTRIIAGHFGRRSFTSNSVYWPPRRGTRSKAGFPFWPWHGRWCMNRCKRAR